MLQQLIQAVAGFAPAASTEGLIVGVYSVVQILVVDASTWKFAQTRHFFKDKTKNQLTEGRQRDWHNFMCTVNYCSAVGLACCQFFC